MAFFTKQENFFVMLMSSVTYPYLLHYTDIVSEDLVQLSDFRDPRWSSLSFLIYTKCIGG